MSASFFCTSWVAASGRPNCLRSSVYWRARCQQSSAAPIDAPGDAVARAVEAAERALEARDVGQQVLLRHDDAVHDDLAGDRGAQRELAADLRRGEALHALLQHEAADLVVMRGRLRPDDEDVGDRRVGDPHLGAGEAVAVGDLLGARLHAAGIGAGIGLGQAEAADPFAGGELRQVLLALRLGAVGVDRVHHQRGLHATSSSGSRNRRARPRARRGRRRRSWRRRSRTSRGG